MSFFQSWHKYKMKYIAQNLMNTIFSKLIKNIKDKIMKILLLENRKI